MVKLLSAMQETQVWSLYQEDPLEKERATHSSILAWKIPWTEEPSGLQSLGSQRVGHNWRLSIRNLSVQEQEKMDISDQEERENFFLFFICLGFQ